MAIRINPFSLILPLLFFFFIGNAQTDIAIGEWKSHLSYSEGRYIAQSDQHIIYSTKWAIVYIDKEDHSFSVLDKVKGLSGVGIERIKYNKANDVLIIAYSNSEIDLVKSNEIVNLSDIRVFNNIAGDKRIYDIFIDSDSTAFLAAGYGVSKINFNQNIFVFSTFTGVKVNSVIVHDDMIYATTEEGIYRAANSPTINLQDFGVWEFLDEADGFPPIYNATEIVTYNDKLYITIDNGLYRYEENSLDSIYKYPNSDYVVQYLTAEGAHLVLGYNCLPFNCSGTAFFFKPDESFTEMEPCSNVPTYGIEDENGMLWLSDVWHRYRTYDIEAKACGGLELNSPYSHLSSDIEVHDGNLWVTAGGMAINFHFNFYFEGFYNLIDGKWNYYNRNNRSELNGTLDYLRFAFHPEEETTYISTFYDGLIEFKDGGFTIFDDSNSSLGNPPPSGGGDSVRTKVVGLAYDELNNLWIANFGAPNPISVLTNEGEWKSFDNGSNNRSLLDITIDENNYKWFTLGNNSAGILIFDEGDLEVNGDERYRELNQNNSALPSNSANCITLDLDGDLWVGTSDGIVIFECGSNAFNSECTGTRKIVEQEGIADYLLRGEDVRTIAIDGANRKWVGTNNGIFVLSSNGEEQVARFTEENSPLFSNLITDIAIDQESGEVYIGTSEGVISYRSDATIGGNFHSPDVLVFPNPVRPEYEGPIAIRGLARDSDVKITDISGQLVYETKANGGEAIWNGRDYTGRKASSGVYLVFGTSVKDRENPEGVVAKILFVN